MPAEITLTYTTTALLQSIRSGNAYGFELMQATGLPSGTVYPALRRLENAGLIRSEWEKDEAAFAGVRPPRKYYRLSASGEQALQASLKRFRMMGAMSSAAE